MRHWEQNKKQGEHVYTLDEFGLGEAMIDESFVEEVRRFMD